MKTFVGLTVAFMLVFVMAMQNTFAGRTGKELKQIEKQAKAICKQYKKEGYVLSGTVLPIEQVVINHLQKLQDGKFLDYESKVSAPTYALGQQKCLGDAQNFMVKLVYDSVRYRYDQAYGGDEANKNKKEVNWTDLFFSAFEQSGAMNIGGMIHPSYTLYKKEKKGGLTEYRMFFIYNTDFIDANKDAISRAISKALRDVDEGVEFGEKVQKFINNGLK